MADKLGLKLDPAGRKVEEFLSEIGIVIAGGSSILVEAGLAGRFSINYPFNQEFRDPYGLGMSGLVAVARSPRELIALIGKQRQVGAMDKQKWRPFCATIGTRFEGRSAELSASVISAIANRNVASLPGWTRVPSSLKAFELIGDQPGSGMFEALQVPVDA